MYESIVARKEQWDAFLRHWPIDKLREMSLEEYTHAGDHDCFVYWLEAKTDSLGSIWGGSAFKFGIYSRKDETEKKANGNLCYAADYGWYCKYGDTPQSAFAKIKENIALVAEGARAGDLVIVDRIDLGQVYKQRLQRPRGALEGPALSEPP